MTESAGITIAGYRGFTRIATGGSSTVYKAYQIRFDRTVAVKVINADLRDASALRRFTRECQAAGRLSHLPEIVTVLDADVTADGRPFIAMEYFGQGSLSDRLISAGPLTAAEVVGVATAVARALRGAHAAGVLHRDLKPGNILVSDSGAVALADFGVAGLAQGSEAASVQSAHTLHFTAPEILEGQPATQAADIYALGVSLHTLLAGEPPFVLGPGEGLANLVRRIIAADPRPPLDAGLPMPLRTLIVRMTDAVPARRPSADDVLVDLAYLRQSVGTMRLPIPPPARSATPGQSATPARTTDATEQVRFPRLGLPAPTVRVPAGSRRRTWVLAAAATTLLLLTVAAIFLVSRLAPDAAHVDDPTSPDSSPTTERPSTVVYQFPANTLSPQYRDGTCVFRIWYGNFGTVPFAKILAYAGECGGVLVTVTAQHGSTISEHADTDWSGGSDTCGPYLEGQATARVTGVGVGQTVYFPATGHRYVFRHDHGQALTPYRTC